MPLGVYLTLDQTVLFNGNYSDVTGFRITGTVYSDIGRAVAFDLTGYTLTLMFQKEGGYTDHLNKTCTIDVAASGTFYLAVTSGSLPPAGLYLASIELSKSGSVVTSLNRVEVLIQRGAQ